MRRCRCTSRRAYARCCEPLHNGAVAKSPEALMRSRYCAYAMGLVPYIMHTTAPGSPHHEDDETAWAASIEAFCQGVHFTGLRILDSPDPMGDEGSVRFVAQLDQNGRDVSFEENSRFVKVDARWLYDRAI